MSEILDFQKRVIDEELETNEKIANLEAFIASDIFQSFDSEEQERVHEQRDIMKHLAYILSERIANFNSGESEELDLEEEDSEDFQ